jgi:hypothetical protein
MRTSLASLPLESSLYDCYITFSISGALYPVFLSDLLYPGTGWHHTQYPGYTAFGVSFISTARHLFKTASIRRKLGEARWCKEAYTVTTTAFRLGMTFASFWRSPAFHASFCTLLICSYSYGFRLTLLSSRLVLRRRQRRSSLSRRPIVYVALDRTRLSRSVPRRADELSSRLSLGVFLSVLVYVSYSEIPPLLGHRPHHTYRNASLARRQHSCTSVKLRYQGFKLNHSLWLIRAIRELRHVTRAAHLVRPHDCLFLPRPGSSSMTAAARHQLTLSHTSFVMQAILRFGIALRAGTDDQPGAKDSCYTDMLRRSNQLAQSHGPALL